MKYTTPAGQYSRLYADMSTQPHLLIAGATGSGKSVVENGIICTLLFHAPAVNQLILIDPKRVELSEYRRLPHVLEYANTPEGCRNALAHAVDIMETRYQSMERRGLRKYDGGQIYVIIDELADLMTTDKKAVQPLLQRLGQLGRAAGIHCICCTQHVLAKTLTTEILVNLDARLGLRMATPAQSRTVIGASGCEALPRYGTGFYRTPDGLTAVKIPMVSDAERRRLIEHWMKQKGFLRRIFAV